MTGVTGMTGKPGKPEYRSRRLILKDWGSEEEVMQFGAEGGWEVLVDEASDIRQGIVRNVIWRVAPGLVLQYAVDSRSHCSAFVLIGSPEDSVQRLQESIERNLQPWTLKELVAAVDKAERAQGAEELYRAVLRAGIGAPRGFDKKFFTCIRRAILGNDPRLRSAGIWATAYSRWPEFLPLLTDVARQDPVDSLRRDAQIILDHYNDEQGRP
ncbi:hypothetical protein [Streptomyces formicae]|uniref:HEAT repeat domain-containing protein n=1 Tax=Streptomyces formicae TaxID=1616117 RepID=A0ABY3WS97_9ACTN|nr:hypothetical protein [Streptomyces formicae]UNM13386.1 hypothetical protein J4032_19550 [Streptomyces formicae]